jgi:hypothetical protein
LGGYDQQNHHIEQHAGQNQTNIFCSTPDIPQNKGLQAKCGGAIPHQLGQQFDGRQL